MCNPSKTSLKRLWSSLSSHRNKHLPYTRRFTSQWRLYGHSGYVRCSSSSKATFGLNKSPQFDSRCSWGRSDFYYRGWLLHARRHHPASTEMYQTKFGSSREAKPRVRIHPSHVGTSPSLLIVRFWFDQVSPSSLTASWHMFSVCEDREPWKIEQVCGKSSSSQTGLAREEALFLLFLLAKGLAIYRGVFRKVLL